MTATERPTWDPAADPQAIPRFQQTRPLLAAAPPPEVWAPPPPGLAAESGPAADGPAEEAPVHVVRQRFEASGAASGPQAKRRIVTIRIDAEEYEAFEFDIWQNPDYAVAALLEDKPGAAPEENLARRNEAVRQIVLATNGWCDYRGQPYPPPSDPAFWQGERAVPPNLQVIVLDAIRELYTQNPNSRRARRPA